MRRIDCDKNTARIVRVVQLVPLRAEVEKHTQLTRQGRGRCPLADHKSRDAFDISKKNPTATPLWYCHACGTGGNVISFFSKIHGVPFLEALAALESIYGLAPDDGSLRELKERLAREKAQKRQVQHRRTLELLDVQLGMIRLERRREEIGNWYRQLLSLDEMDELTRLADQWMILWARFEELMKPAVVYVSEWKQRCRDIADLAHSVDRVSE